MAFYRDKDGNLRDDQAQQSAAQMQAIAPPPQVPAPPMQDNSRSYYGEQRSRPQSDVVSGGEGMPQPRQYYGDNFSPFSPTSKMASSAHGQPMQQPTSPPQWNQQQRQGQQQGSPFSMPQANSAAPQQDTLQGGSDYLAPQHPMQPAPQMGQQKPLAQPQQPTPFGQAKPMGQPQQQQRRQQQQPMGGSTF